VTAGAATTAGAVAGALLGIAGAGIGQSVRVSVGLVGALVLCVAPLVPQLRPLQLNRETKQRLLERGPLQWGVLNGSLLGLGFTSRIGFWTWYLIPLSAFTIGSPLAGAAVWAMYGLSRMGAASFAAIKMRRDESCAVAVADRMLGARGSALLATNVLVVALCVPLVLRLGL
jgi:hypothetical protein